MTLESRINWRVAGALFLTATVLSIYFFTGSYGTDDSEYTSFVRTFSTGAAIEHNKWAARWFLTLPLGVYGWLLDLDSFWSASFISVQFVAFVVATYCAMAWLFDRTTATLAGILILFCPLLYVYSGAVFPDLTLTALLAFQVFLAIALYRDRLKNPKLGFFLIGVLYGLSYTLKEPFLLFSWPIPVLLIALWIREQRLPLAAILLSGAGAFSIFIIDVVLCVTIFGEPLPRWMQQGLPRNVERGLVRTQTQGILPWDRLSYLAKVLDEVWLLGTVFVATGILLPLLLAFRRFRTFEFSLFSITVSLFVLLHLFIPFSVKQYVPLPTAARYYMPPIVVWLLMAAWVAGRVWPRLTQNVILPAAVAFGLANVVYAAPQAGRVYTAELVQDFFRIMDQVERGGFEGDVYLDNYLARRTLEYGIPVAATEGKELRPGTSDYLILVRSRGRNTQVENYSGPASNIRRDARIERLGQAPVTRWDALKVLFGRADRAHWRPSRVAVYRVRPAKTEQ